MRIKEYSTDELLMIANNVSGEYSDKQVRQAKLELYNRGVDNKVIAGIIEEKEEAFMKRLDAAARAEQARMDKRNEKNRNISYQWWEMLIMFAFAPFYGLSGWKDLVFTEELHGTARRAYLFHPDNRVLHHPLLPAIHPQTDCRHTPEI